MPDPSALLRPRDTDALRGALRRMAAEGAAPVLFAGEVHRETLLLSEFVGTRTSNLRGLAVQSKSGLGGASMVAGRPMSVADYRNAATITHDYDAPVLSEGIRSVLAVPVLVDGQTRAMLYAAHRSGSPFGGRAADLLVSSAHSLAEELRIRDEVDRRLRLRETQLAGAAGAGTERIREVHAELRGLAASSPLPLQNRLRELADRLVGALATAPPGAAPLSPRELDVLAQVALGCTNSEAAQRLSLKPETVKSYLRSAAAKLGAHTRHESVSKARRAGLIP
ncbi:LuxR C-terminal-related transcriptional regulator [Mycolicibacterium chlorophenolicum]|uniref:Bacterial regulatory protein, luxR family n=1 Tax=Mycolicibacterium chlorophenolicum TaxID=37916 RepID=A0A0J6VDY2_9MYCO|nr:LuxR C-terminal-related transcriptional regulator [Mycolicibacterium chlorophenolicum]KMO67743.1 Bacterial regulatory protein, luxR family [Mycolicibacterium chlorophenolicum]